MAAGRNHRQVRFRWILGETPDGMIRQLMAKRARTNVGLTPEEARSLLQQVGLRRTASRVAVLCHLAAAASPLSHAEVVTLLEHSGFGAPTIFRCLCDLAEAGLAKRIDLGDHVWRFGFHGRHPENAEHPHFLCVDCGSATCLPDVEVAISPSQRRSVGDVTEVVFKGHCPNCR